MLVKKFIPQCQRISLEVIDKIRNLRSVSSLLSYITKSLNNRTSDDLYYILQDVYALHQKRKEFKYDSNDLYHIFPLIVVRDYEFSNYVSLEETIKTQYKTKYEDLMVETIQLSFLCLFVRVQEQVIYNDFESKDFFKHKVIIDLYIKIVNQYVSQLCERLEKTPNTNTQIITYLKLTQTSFTRFYDEVFSNIG